MVADLKNDYEVNGKRSWKSVNYYLPHLRGFFGFDRAIDLSPDRVRAYQNHRLGEGAANATVNREVAILGRMLSLANGAGKLSRKPRFQMLEENNVRQGFLEHGDFLTLLGNLPAHLRPLVEFLYLSGWRKGEAAKLEWRDVDLNGKAVRLRIENSKNKEARVLPLTGRLLEIIEHQKTGRRLDCHQVFHLKGRPIKEFRKSWRAACVAAGVGRLKALPDGKRKKYEGIIVHDLRRCAARNLSRAGVPEAVARKSRDIRPAACIGVTELSTSVIYGKRRLGFRITWSNSLKPRLWTVYGLTDERTRTKHGQFPVTENLHDVQRLPND